MTERILSRSLIALLALLASCSRMPLEKPELAMRPRSAPFLQDDLNFENFASAIEAQAASLAKKQTIMKFGERQITSQRYAQALLSIVDVWKRRRDREAVLFYIKENFDFLEVYGQKKWGEVHITSYFEPVIPGSLKPRGRFTQPLYKKPDDLVVLDLENFDEKFSNERKMRGRLVKGKLVPYFSRAEIDSHGALAGRKLEICYVDPIDAFFLHVQGSGVVRLDNGKELILNFAEKNGHKYQSIGNFVRKALPKGHVIDLKTIEDFLLALPPDELQKYLNQNPSFVFFKIADKNAVTSSGLPATAGRTIASDKRFFPQGAVAYLEMPDPEFEERRIRRLVIDQDSGGAILGGGRIDLFWGRGGDAKYIAGKVNHKGTLVYLFPKIDIARPPLR